jgi:hypothetical protein
MNEKRESITNRFTAASDDGFEFIVIEYLETIRTPAQGNNKCEVISIKKWKTDKGHLLSQIDANTYKFAETGRIIRRTYN